MDPESIALIGQMLEAALKPIQADIQNVKASLLSVQEAIQIATESKLIATDAQTKAQSAIDGVTVVASQCVEARGVADNAAASVVALTTRVSKLESDLTKSLADQSKQHEQLLAMESYSRRNNLIFEGVQEAPQESISQVMRQIISDLGLAVANVTFIGCHRIGSAHGQASRPVIIKFLTYDDRKSVWKLRSKTSRGVWVKEDYPLEIDRRRKILWPYLRAAYQGDPANPDRRVSAYIRLDKLHVNNQCFTYEMLDRIPEYLKAKVSVARPSATKQTDTTTIFFSKHSIMSNFFPCNFTIGDQLYNAAEQYLAHQKALLFGANETAAEILSMTNPADMKKRARHLNGFNTETWSTEAPRILREALHAKFSENADLRAALLATNDTKIGEACASDNLFGIGLSLRDPHAMNSTNWKGKNIQGVVLMEMRQAIKDGLI